MKTAGGKPRQIRRDFKLLQGGLCRQYRFGSLRIAAAPLDAPPFHVEAIVFEEDTWLVVSAEPEVCEPEIHPVKLMTEMIEARPEPAGCVLVRSGRPLRFLAVVHDFNEDPSWRKEWVESALADAFEKAENMRLKAVGLQLLGAVHGRLRGEDFAAILSRVLMGLQRRHLERLWLIVHEGFRDGDVVMDQLERALRHREVTSSTP